MTKILELPESFSAVAQDYVDFSSVLAWFDWSLKSEPVAIDFRHCRFANYQALALLVQYFWTLRVRDCNLDTWYGDGGDGTAYDMWTRMGARGWSQVLNNSDQNFQSGQFKPLIAIRQDSDRTFALAALEEYVKNFPIGYREYLSDAVNELLYNTLEHGQHHENGKQVPSLLQYSWYQNRDEISILVADTGVGIKRHLEQHYKAFETDIEAIRFAINPETSGTFGHQREYSSMNNAGMGLFLSSRLMQILRADMWIVSGNGQVHISPRETTSQHLAHPWPGTFVLMNLKLRQAPPAIPHSAARSALIDEAREAHEKIAKGGSDRLVVSMFNYFGKYPEGKSEAIRFRDGHLLPAVEKEQSILLDFQNVEKTTHSFLNALLAGPIRAYTDKGLNPYKYVRCTNESQDLRETVTFILDTNT